jgi:cell division protein YceG involved in septum cleavage
MVVKRRRPKPLLIVIVIGILMIIMALIWIFLSSPVDRSDDTEVKIEIKAGVGTQGIADILKENNEQ